TASNRRNREGTMAACFRYIVNDVDAAIEFYTRHLGFKVEMHPAPGFAEISRGDMHLYLTRPSPGVGGGAAMPSGEQQKPGGWNRIHLIVGELDGTVAQLKAAGCRFRSNAIQGTGGKQILLEDPSGNLVELFQPNTPAYRAPGSGSKAGNA
ncbi:MAG TPA: VOC family protein, partial [Stellaceae bacterium]|nr:VOC family protein [Stellaceae bacterium]